MTHLPSWVLAQYLVNRGFGVWWDTKPKPAPSVFRVSYGTMGVGDEKDPRYLDDRAVSCLDTGTKNQDARSHRSGEPTMFPEVQVRCRGLNDREVNAKLSAIAKDLEQLYCQQVTLEAVNYRIQNFSRQYDPAFLMQEEKNNRRVWVISGNLTIWEES